MGSLFSSSKKSSEREEGAKVTENPSTPTHAEATGQHQQKPVGDDIHNRACFGAGCYWGTEKFFKINFARKMYPESMIKNTFVGRYHQM